jgi:hypothetical protein
MEECSRPRTRWLRIPPVILFAFILAFALNESLSSLGVSFTVLASLVVAALDAVVGILVAVAFRNWWYA